VRGTAALRACSLQQRRQIVLGVGFVNGVQEDRGGIGVAHEEGQENLYRPVIGVLLVGVEEAREFGFRYAEADQSVEVDQLLRGAWCRKQRGKGSQGDDLCLSQTQW
jgi:hypothetical protein